jgi:hypothetical protein
MQRLADRQREFAAALLDATLAVPSGLVGPDGGPSAKRFGVYRNNVVIGLTEALQAAFPAICRIVGEEFFRAMARVYAVSHPPSSPILLDYGAGFPDFIAGFEPAAALPYLADVARIERAWTEAYHSRDAAALEPEALAVVPGDRVADIRLVVHPSVRIVRSRFPALTVWRMNVADGTPAPVDFESGGEDALIARPDAEVEVRAMPEGGAEFVEALAVGDTLAESTKSAIAAYPSFDLAGNLTALIGSGIFIGYCFAGDVNRQGTMVCAS